ncbi:PepSY domain-containing protein [Oceanobacillus sp. CAU 1775]
MNKKIIMTIAALSIAAVIGLIFSQNISVSADPDLTREDIEEKVRAQYPGEITEIDLDTEGKIPVYEVELEIEGKEYELVIDGNTGEVLRLDEKLVVKTEAEKATPNKVETEKREKEAIEIKEKETEEKAEEKAKADKEASESKKATVTAPKNTEKQAKTESKQTEKPKAQQKEQAKKPAEKKQEPKKETKKEKKSIITQEQAVNIALKQFSGKVEDVELDDDDGRLIYEIEIENDRGDEAEIEIDAYTGAVLVVDIDLEED